MAWELHRGQVVHDGDVNEAPGILHDAEDGLEVLSPASCTEGRGGTLSEMGKQMCSFLFVCNKPTVEKKHTCGRFHTVGIIK